MTPTAARRRRTPTSSSARIPPSRRSLHEVRICQTRAPKNARSSGVRSVTGPNNSRISRNTRRRHRRACAETAAGTTKVGFPYCVNPSRVVGSQVIRHLAPVKRRYAAHGVDYVLVETREEPKPVLARATGAGSNPVTWRADVRWCPRPRRPRECCGPCLRQYRRARAPRPRSRARSTRARRSCPQRRRPRR